MAKPGDAHLSPEQLERLTQRDGIARSESGPEEARAQSHLAECTVCQRRAQMYEAADKSLAKLRADARAPARAGCPAEAEWLRVAAGLTPPSEAENYLLHASQCDHCGPLLRRAAEDFAELTPQEEAVLASLESAKPVWQHELAERMDATLRKLEAPREATRARVWLTWPRWAFAAAVVAVVVVAAWWTLRSLRSSSPERLLAEAYTQQRSLEMRIPQARSAPLRVERGPERSRLSRPPALLEAEALIARKLAAHPQDAAWLAAKGRADLLDWHYEAAIHSLKRALDAKPDLPPLLTDLASAYFERAEAEDRAIDYGTAIELLGQVLVKNPDDPIALFNRAIAYERMFLYHEAVKDWEHYLRVDAKSDWAPEAQRRLKVLQQKLRSHQPAKPETDPETAARVLGERADGHVPPGGWPDSLDEEYLDTAIRQWLPALYPTGSSKGPLKTSPPERSALEALARVLRQQHGDRWLEDLLASPPSLNFAEGLRELGRAVKANAAGDPAGAEVEAEKAERLFQSAGSDAGLVRSRFERVYALHRAAKTIRCLGVAVPLAQKLERRGYAWAEAQLSLEQASCRGMREELGAAGRLSVRAVAVARAANYGTLHLRGLSYVADLEKAKGNLPKAWLWNRAGLARYWAGLYPGIRAYEFYTDLELAAETSSQWQLAKAMAREAITALDAASNRAAEPLARYTLATVAYMAGAVDEAKQQFEYASLLFAALPQSATTRLYQMDGEIYLAALEAQRGDFDNALARLSKVRRELPQLPNYTAALMYYQALGELHLRRGENTEAERALRSAVSIAESGLHSVPSEPDRLRWDRTTGKAYRALTQLKFQGYGDAAGALDLWEWYRAAALRSSWTPAASHGEAHAKVSRFDFASLEADPPLPAMKEIQDVLPFLSQETIVSYALLPEGLAIWVFDNRGIHSGWVTLPTRDLESLARRFSEECADPAADRGTLQRDARQLYQWLIAPVAPHLETERTLVVEPDGEIAYIPMEALVDPAGQFLGTRYAIIASPGIGYARRLREAAAFSRLQRALVVTTPTLTGELAAILPPLPDASREARAVAARFGGARVLSGSEATMEVVRRELPRAEVFHFAGHAIASTKRAGLLLAPSVGQDAAGESGAAVLNADRLQPALIRQCQLAVLSACSTGTGEKGLVDPESLVRAFLRAGVPHVVASRWNVDSATTANFMDAFYPALLSGSSVARALQSASAEIRRHPETSHPYYWAAFGGFGRG